MEAGVHAVIYSDIVLINKHGCNAVALPYIFLIHQPLRQLYECIFLLELLIVADRLPMTTNVRILCYSENETSKT